MLPWLPRCCRGRRPHLQGRFSGRLATKDDEKKLNMECKLLGPLLGGVGKRGDGSRLTLAKIVRGIAAGEVRKFCEERERQMKVGRGGNGPCYARPACKAQPSWRWRARGRTAAGWCLLRGLQCMLKAQLRGICILTAQ